MKLTKIRVNQIVHVKQDDEYELSKKVSKYLLERYPKIVFWFDFASGTRLTPGQTVRMKELNPRRGYPDLFIAHVKTDGLGGTHSCGCFIELKKDGERIYKKNGNPASKHIAEQLAYLEVLGFEGYHAEICVGFEEAKETIDWYLSEYKVNNG